MTEKPADVRSPELIQRLRRLGLIDDTNRLPELDGWLPVPMQQTLLAAGGTRAAVRMWLDSKGHNDSLPLTGLLVVLSHMREHPGDASTLIRGFSADFADELARCALDAGRALHSASRQQFGLVNLDLAVNASLEAQREFLFAVTSGRLTDWERTEALGKYAVAVALSARWSRPRIEVLRRAYAFQLNSIRQGNRAPEAHTYLVELLGELFNQTGDEAILEEALAVTTSESLALAEAELLLKRGLLRGEHARKGSMSDLQRASELARTTSARTGVEFVQRALIREMALCAILGKRPLGGRELRLPYGFLQELAGLTPARLDATVEIVVDALAPMREELRSRGARPNLVAQQVLTALYRQVLERSGFRSMATAGLLVRATEDAAAASTGSRHLQWQYADALLARAITSGLEPDITTAVAKSRDLSHVHASWPLPRVTLARALQLSADLAGSPTSTADVGRAWTDAINLVTESAEFRRADLGGRSGVFAVDDARGDLSTTLVFKPVPTADVGHREAVQLRSLQQAIASIRAEDRFAVPASLGVFQAAAGGFVHVIERYPGKLLSSLDPEVAAQHLGECAALLALFHRTIDVSGTTASGWQPLRKGLKLWCGALFPATGEADIIIERMKSALPPGLPLVRKRDSHPGNWVIDAANRVVAIDLDSPVVVPIGHDLAQLVEDGALLPVSDDGFLHRYSLFRSYLADVGVELDGAEVEVVYDWFALYRAIWTATSSLASKAQHSHARQLVRHIASSHGGGHALGDVAESVSSAMRSQSPSSKVSELTASQRRISKSMSKVLRHSAVDAGLQPDDGGFVALEDLAREIRQGTEVLLEVATHPAEPRFQVIDDRIRALYGHSFPVLDLYEVNVEMPDTLFHGSSWDHLSQIAAEGLRPLLRQHVHLTNNPSEAIEVARRHGHAVLLAVATSSIGSLRAVADAVWAATEVDAAGVRVLNAFEELPTPPAWMADDAPVEDR